MFFGYSQLAAQGMSLAFSVGTASLTTLAYTSKVTLIGGVASAGDRRRLNRRYGVDLAHRLPERALRLVFVGFTITVAIATLITARG